MHTGSIKVVWGGNKWGDGVKWAGGACGRMLVKHTHLLGHCLNKELEDFKYPNSLIKFDLDAYIIKVYPHDHKMNALYKADKIYWMDLFTKNSNDDFMISQYEAKKVKILDKFYPQSAVDVEDESLKEIVAAI